MQSDEHLPYRQHSLLPIGFWVVLLASIAASSLLQRSEAIDSREDSQPAIEQRFRFNSVQFLTDFRAINS